MFSKSKVTNKDRQKLQEYIEEVGGLEKFYDIRTLNYYAQEIIYGYLNDTPILFVSRNMEAFWFDKEKLRQMLLEDPVIGHHFTDAALLKNAFDYHPVFAKRLYPILLGLPL